MSITTGIRAWIRRALQKEPIETRLTKEQVVNIANAYLVAQSGYHLREPYGVGVTREKHGVVWHICDSINTRGGNYHILISDDTGNILKAWATPM